MFRRFHVDKSLFAVIYVLGNDCYIYKSLDILKNINILFVCFCVCLCVFLFLFYFISFFGVLGHGKGPKRPLIRFDVPNEIGSK